MRPLSFALFILAATATATAAPVAAQEWSGNATVYGWFPAIEGNQEGPDGQPIVDVTAEDLLEALNFAFFATGEARRDRWGLYFDFAYVDLGSDAEAKPPFTANASVDTSIWFLTAAGTWRLRGDTENFIDAYGGLRYYSVGLDFDVSALNDHVQRSISADANWFDPVLGIKARYPFNDRWSIYGFGDVGGFGIDGSSDLTWQAYTGVNYAFTEKIAGNLGYRYMSIDYDDEIKLDVDIYGPVLGVTWRF
ncbi:MAG TPA: outer membrane beta-barrel protein [Sinorhizobium sp.]|nr:outer membrane beta-barrel protein [Sinorhizobium sp.]